MENKRPSLNFTLTLCMSLFCLNVFAKNTPNWQNLSKGVEYHRISPKELGSFAQIHVFRLNLKEVQLNYCNMRQPTSYVARAGTQNKALIATNGAFFSPDFTPLGLRVIDGKITSPLKPISWWGVFYIKNNKAALVNFRQYRHSKQISFAIQAGPRLIIKRKIPKLKSGLAARTALGITPDGKVILLVTENASLSTTALALFMRDSLNCQYALNLDGGGSTQLYAQIDSFKKMVYGFTKVPTPLCVSKLY